MARPSAILRLPRASLGRATGYLPLVAIMAGAVGLILAEFLVLREIRTITVVPRGGTVTGGAHHAYALAVIGVALLVMGVGAGLRRARPAAVACVVLSACAVFVVLAIDLPGIDDAGIFAETYDLAQAHPSTGFYLESAAAAVALVGSVWALLLTGPVGRRRPRAERAARERERAARRESPDELASPPRDAIASPPPDELASPPRDELASPPPSDDLASPRRDAG